MLLNKNKYYLSLLIIALLFSFFGETKSQNVSDSLKPPRLYGISYNSAKIPELKKYYKKIISDTIKQKNWENNILATIYLAETYRYELKHDSSRFILRKSKELMNKYHIAIPFVNYQYCKANAANLYFSKKYQRLLKYADSTLLLAKQNNYDSLEVGDLYFLKYTSYNMTYKYDSALFFLLKSQSSYPKNIRQKELYSSLHRLCALYKDNGYLKKAENALYDALKNCDPLDPYQKSKTYFSLGEHFIDINDYEKGLQYFRLQLSHDSISGILSPENHSKTLLAIGDIYRIQNKWHLALGSYIQAKKILPRTPSYEYIKAHISIGKIYSRLDSLKKAEYNLKKAVKLSKKGGFIESDNIKANALNELGIFETNYLKEEIGIRHIDSCVNILKHKYGNNSRLLYMSYAFLSDAYKSLHKDYKSSMEYLQKALQLNLDDTTIIHYYQKIDAYKSINLLELMAILNRKITLLKTQLKAEKDKEEIGFLISALNNTIITYIDAEELIRNKIRDTDSKLTRSSLYKSNNTLVLKSMLFLYNMTGNEKYLHFIYKNVAKNKAITLQESLRESKAKFAHIPDTLIRLESDYNRRIGSLKDLINRENRLQKPQKEKINTWRIELQNTLLLKDQLILKFDSDYPEYFKLKYTKKKLTVSQVQNHLKENQALIEYSVLDDNSIIIFGITKDAFQLIPLKPDTTVFNSLEKLLNHISSNNIRQFDNIKFNDFACTSYHLYNTLIKPVSNLIEGKELFINPDDKLWYLPFEVLLTDTLNQTKSYQNLSYLIKSNPISYAYSSRLLFDKVSHKKTMPGNILAIVPSYNKSTNFEKEILEKNKTIRSSYNPLPASIEEAKYIHHILGGKLLTGDKASEKNFKKLAGKYSILHLAMHAIIDNEHPQYSKLIFTQGVDTSEDNFLNTYEIYNKPLNAQMAVLSSCNSGSGKMQKGVGIISIARAFLYAGCPSLVYTLWSVDDRESAKLMQYYYDFLKQGKNKSIAMQQAKIKFLATASPIHQHPYYWAAYNIIGLNDPIHLEKSYKIYYVISGILLLLLIFLKKIRNLLKLIKS